jgi:hypothetical protein
MVTIARARIFISPNNQYTTIVEYRTEGEDGDTLVSATKDQTLAAAFNKARDDLSTIAVAPGAHKQITISTRIE